MMLQMYHDKRIVHGSCFLFFAFRIKTIPIVYLLTSETKAAGGNKES